MLVAWSYAGRIVADYLRHFGTKAIAGLNIIGAKTNSDPAFNAPLLVPHQQGMASADLETNVRSTIAFVEACARQWDAAEFAQQLAAAMVVPPYVRAALLGRPLDADDLYRAIDIPVLFSHGAHDPIAPLAAAQHGHADHAEVAALDLRECRARAVHGGPRTVQSANLRNSWRAARRETASDPAHQIGRDLADAADAEQRHVAVDLVLQQRERAPHAGFAGDDGRVQERPADEDEIARRAPAP